MAISCIAVKPGAGLYAAWNYRALIRITNPVSQAGYQHKLLLSWLPGMRSDFSDIRFTTADGLDCPYWIRSDNIVAFSSCEVWIRVPVASRNEILMFWGNGSCSSASSGEDVFEFFDDFEGDAVDTAKWTVSLYDGTATVSGGICTLTVNATYGDAILLCNSWFGQNYAVRARMKTAHFDSTSYQEEAFLWGNNSCLQMMFSTQSEAYTGTCTTADGDGASDPPNDITGWVADTYAVIDMIRNGGTSAIFKVNDTSIATITTNLYSDTQYLRFVSTTLPDSSQSIDWAIVRKCAATEPTLAISIIQPNPEALHHLLLGADASFTARYSFLVSASVWMPTQGNLTIGGSSSRDLATKTWTAQVRYNKGTTGGIGSAMFDTNILLYLPDHNAVSRCVFCGYYPSQRGHYEPANNSEEFIGYDYAAKLSGQVLPQEYLSILDPDDQDLTHYHRMDYDYVVNNFTAGKIITGATSGATAEIVATQGTWLYGNGGSEQYLVPANAIVLKNITGTFQDNETITEIGSSGQATVNGALTNLDFGPDTIYPQDWLTAILGGTDKWATTAGIYPYRINPVNPAGAGSWTAKPCTQWTFQSTEKKQQAIDRVNAYHNFILFIKWRPLGAYAYAPCAYWVHQDDIDNPSDYALTEHRGLDLPDPVTIAAGNTYLVGKVEATIAGESRVNKVTVRCQDFDGVWYQNTRVPDISGNEGTCTESAGVYYGQEIPVEHFIEDENLISQADCDDAAALLYSYLSLRLVTYKATFRQRTDFELLQKLVFSSYAEIPAGTYRIIGIEYEWEAAAVFVNVTLIPDDQFKASLAVNRMYTNSTIEVQRIIKAELAKIPQAVAGTVDEISGNKVLGTTEGGIQQVTRKLS